MKREKLIDYVYLRLNPEQKQVVRDELAEDFVLTFNVLQLMEKRAANELDVKINGIEDEPISTHAKGRPIQNDMPIEMPKLHRTGRGGKIDDSSSIVACEIRKPVLPMDVLRAYLLDDK